MATALRKNLNALAAPQNDRADMRENWPDPLPTRYLVRTIDLKMVGGRLLASYRSLGPAQQIPAGQTIEDIVAALLGAPAGLPFIEVAVRDEPGTPLDIAVTGEPIFIILIVGEPSNMTFHPELKAMTHKNQYDRDYYGLLRHVSAAEPNGNADAIADCTLIYFVANPVDPDQTSYDHGFNMNVRFAQDPSPLGNPRVLDVEIDPDIRYPGV